MRTILRRLRARVAGAFDTGRRDRELREELDAHLQMQIDANIRAGMPAAEARRRARIKLGNETATGDTIRDARGLPAIDSIGQDLRYGCRTLLRAPGFALSTIAVLALGIGTTVAVASIAHAVVWLPLPVPDPQSVVKIAIGLDGEFDRKVSGHGTWLSYPEFEAYRQATRTLSGVAATRTETVMLESGGTVTPISAALVSANYFTVLRPRAALGRVFSESDAHQAVAVLSHRGWQRRFGGDPEIVGTSLTIDRHVYEVVGVAEPGFTGVDIDSPDLWAPFEAFARASNQAAWLTDANYSVVEPVGRLRDGTPLEQAQAEAAAIAAQFDLAYPGRRTSIYVGRAARLSSAFAVRSAASGRSSDFVKAGLGLSVASLVLLMILALCASNAAGLLLARGAARQREIAVRVALGASRRRVVRQLVTESAVIAFAAGALGILLSTWLLRSTAHLLPMGEVLATLRPGPAILVFTLLVSTATTILFGLLPARAAANVDTQSALRTDGPGISPSASTVGLRNAILIGQVATTMVLLLSTALLTRGIIEAASFTPGFDTRTTYTLSVDLSRQGYDAARQDTFMRELLTSLQADPSVAGVALTSVPPFAGRGLTSAGTGQTSLRPTQFNLCDRAYFEVLAIPLVAGRLFEPRDASGVAVVTESFARMMWPDDPAPVGRRFLARGDEAIDAIEVIGIVKTVETVTLGAPDEPTFYRPLQAAQRSGAALVISGSGRTADAIRAAVRRLDSRLFVAVTSIADQVERAAAPARVGAAAAGILGALALLISAVGIHGVVAYAVVRRTREIGVHLALGATGQDVVRLVLASTLRPVAIGAIAGLAIAVAGARMLSHLLYGVSAIDPVATGGAIVILGLVTLLASYPPVRRALTIGPLTALRSE